MFINVYEYIQSLMAVGSTPGTSPGSWGVGTSTHYFVNVLCVEQRNKPVPRFQCRSQSATDAFQA